MAEASTAVVSTAVGSMIVGSMVVGSEIIYLLAQDLGTDILMGTTGIPMRTPTVILMGTTGIAGGIRASMSSAALPPENPGWMLKVQNADRLGAAEQPVWDDMRRS